jgi:hypothetical protein
MIGVVCCLTVAAMVSWSWTATARLIWLGAGWTAQLLLGPTDLVALGLGRMQWIRRGPHYPTPRRARLESTLAVAQGVTVAAPTLRRARLLSMLPVVMVAASTSPPMCWS